MKEGRTHPFAFNGEAGSRSFYNNTISGRDACGGPKPAGRPSKQNVPYQCETLDCSLRSPSWERSTHFLSLSVSATCMQCVVCEIADRTGQIRPC